MTIRDPSSTPVYPSWKHKKTGFYYDIILFANIENGCIPAVVYRAQRDGSVWVRPCSEFFEKFEEAK